MRSSSACAITFAHWFASNRPARTFVAEWLKMRETFETDWSVARVLRHLREAHGCPLKSEIALQRWLKETHPEQYKRVITR